MKTRLGASCVAFLTALSGVAGCSGQIGDPPLPAVGTGAAGTGGSGMGAGGGPVANCVQGAPFAPARVWLLTDEEYVNVVRDVFGVTLTGTDADITTGKSVTGEYSNLSEGSAVGTPEAQSYQRTASKVATQVVARMPQLVASCTAAPDVACVDKFIRTIVPQAWRRPVTDAEVAGLTAIYSNALPDGAARGASLVVQAVVQSGSFLYRTEIGTNATTTTQPVALTSNELASALSFMFLDSVPDAPLRAKAQDGTLTTPAVLAAEVDRLMVTPAVQATLTKKVSFWAGMERIPLVQKDLTKFPEWTETLRDSLYQGAQKFLQEIVSGGTLTDLMSSKKVFANQEIAKVYGFAGVTGTGLVAVTGQNGNAGIFTQPAILAATNHRQAIGDPIHRGLYIYNQYVCADPVPDPPANALAIAAMMVGTERELAAQRAMMSCKACHARFDPMGLTTESYDPIGRYQPNVDSSSEIVGIGPDLDGHVLGIDELASKLRTGRRVADCAAGSLEKYSLGYSPEAENACSLADVKDAFAKSGSFTDFFRALATSPGFLTRDPGPVK